MIATPSYRFLHEIQKCKCYFGQMIIKPTSCKRDIWKRRKVRAQTGRLNLVSWLFSKWFEAALPDRAQRHLLRKSSNYRIRANRTPGDTFWAHYGQFWYSVIQYLIGKLQCLTLRRNKVQGRGSTFRVCHAHLKNAILLHSSLVAGVSFFPRLYISKKLYGLKICPSETWAWSISIIFLLTLGSKFKANYIYIYI